eukprot:2146477-Pyramimonas_sp.AAC.1
MGTRSISAHLSRRSESSRISASSSWEAVMLIVMLFGLMMFAQCFCFFPSFHISKGPRLSASRLPPALGDAHVPGPQ